MSHWPGGGATNSTCDGFAAVGDPRLDLQVGNREPVHDVFRSDHRPDRLACRDLYRRRLERVLGRRNLDIVHGLICGAPPLTESSTHASADDERSAHPVIAGGGHGRPLERHVRDGDRMIDPVERHLRQAEHLLQPVRLHLHRSR
jgi:hypothetical protein